MTEKEKLGKHLLSLREKIPSIDYNKNNISQQELADNNIGLTKFLIGTSERGHANPTLDKLVLMAKALNLEKLSLFEIEINVDKYLKELEYKKTK
ncbi:helix-turn-helix domain-containing protein [Formosa sp. 3Alg 14/1]|uniref:helix-turn-helix domain-containing protein n=1 Tax=Formosa sp. 3Alg 14/1 TaxID=3382190 RepID=UPI0039BDDF6F